MKWVYLSPHLDDAVYSCGGLIHQQVQLGIQVEVWTIFSGHFEASTLTPFAADIHRRWGTGMRSIEARRNEDQAACASLGAIPRYFDFQDVIYRFKENGKAEIMNNEDLFRSYLPADDVLMESVSAVLKRMLDDDRHVQICAPLALGNHIDHQILHRAANTLRLESPSYYYADFPYVVRENPVVPLKNQKQFPLNEENVRIWCKAIALYGSQISTFWKKESDICEEIIPYWQNGGGSCLWISEQ